MKTAASTHAFVAGTDDSSAPAVAHALRSRGWTADTGSPEEVPAALQSGRYSVAVAEFGAHSPWQDPPGAGPQPDRAARLVALCRAEEAFHVLRKARPCSYALQPLDARSVADAAAALARSRSPGVQLQFEDGMILDRHARRVFRPGGMSQLRPREFDLLRLLVARRGRVVSREETIVHLYRWGEDIGSNAVDVHIHSLRRKLAHLPICTVRGEGYMLCEATG